MSQKLESNRNLLLINSIGGIGKTALAREYFHQNKHKYVCPRFVDISSGLEGAFMKEFLTEFNISPKDPYFMNTVLRKLSSHNCGAKKLLIIDNVNTQAEVDILKDLSDFDLIFTARNKFNFSQNEILELEKFDEKTAIQLFRKRCSRNINEEKIKKILGYLDFHTLFIELTAKTIEEGDEEIDAIIAKFESGEFAHINFDEEDTFNSYLKSTFEKTFTESTRDHHQLLLQKLSLFHSEEIELNILKELFLDEKINLKLNSLCKQGWLIRTENNGIFSYKLHQIIKEFLNANYLLEFGEVEKLCDVLIEKTTVNQENGESYSDIDKIKFSELSQYFVSFYKNIKIGTLYNNMGNFKLEFSLFKDAKFFQKKAINIKEEFLTNNDPSLILNYCNYAEILRVVGNDLLAMDYLKKALNIAELSLGDNDIEFAKIYEFYVLILLDLGRFEDALFYQKKAIKIKKKYFHCNDIELSISYGNMGVIFQGLNLLTKALYYQEKDLKICKNFLKENHESLAISYSNISLTLNDLNFFERALSYQKKSLSIVENIFNGNHHELAKGYNNISLIYVSLQKLYLALEYQEKAIKIQEAIFEKNHPCLGKSYFNIANIYYKLNNLFLAKNYINRAVKIAEKVLEKDHPNLQLYLQAKNRIDNNL